MILPPLLNNGIVFAGPESISITLLEVPPIVKGVVSQPIYIKGRVIESDVIKGIVSDS